MRILFVCTGNTCRSPMAEAIVTAKNLKEIEARSAGIFAGEAPLSENAQSVLNQQQISFSHTSKPLDMEDLEWAELVLTMTNSHKMAILQAYPETAAKLFTLKEFAADSTEDVSDPYGGPIALYEKTFQELKLLIDKLIMKIT
ncbi:Low molecular weight protein tyrosine phosphatase [Planococcus halocryophilus Or1]|uniref:Low molecular weight phosphatase family protein n=1 Tax=Planococcus halocryophilus TaxID=1215089 RepID=A0A1C7DS60_9BACL|nr:low molecular weight protein arginine phosphatase [Planococcus halocryophilus]ANU14033.1 low molecular weight phosphatase family protein [Planococcus halocryophilus]EMF47368.1 Low molecular weight protein tyrosine phosphatase [Planococcus halocryophilus Or1]